MLPGQADLNSDRGSRYVTMIHKRTFFCTLTAGQTFSRAFSPITFLSRAFHWVDSFPALSTGYVLFPRFFNRLLTSLIMWCVAELPVVTYFPRFPQVKRFAALTTYFSLSFDWLVALLVAIAISCLICLGKG